MRNEIGDPPQKGQTAKPLGHFQTYTYYFIWQCLIMGWTNFFLWQSGCISPKLLVCGDDALAAVDPKWRIITRSLNTHTLLLFLIAFEKRNINLFFFVVFRKKWPRSVPHHFRVRIFQWLLLLIDTEKQTCNHQFKKNVSR